MKDKKLYKCPKCGWVVHSAGRYGKKWRCTNPDCPVVIVENLDPVKAGVPKNG